MINAIEICNMLNTHWKKHAEITHVLTNVSRKYSWFINRKRGGF